MGQSNESSNCGGEVCGGSAVVGSGNKSSNNQSTSAGIKNNHRRSLFLSKWNQLLIICIFHMASVLSQALTQGPRFAEGIPNVTVAVGRDASLPCVVENLGNHKVAFLHINRKMILTISKHIVTRIPRFSVSYDSHKTWMLNIHNVQQEDRGYYMCQVNVEPMISQVGYLQVVVPPSIIDEASSESTAIRENMNLTLTCKAEGFPEPRITWRREDGQPFSVDRRKKVNVSEGERLQLYKISRTDMAAYLCIANNGVPPIVSKRILVEVEFSPMIAVPAQLVSTYQGTNVTLECHTEAFPRAISYWVYENMMLLSTGKYLTENIENGYRTHMKLTIRNIREKDFGKYQCVSKNSLGETEGTVRLYQIPVPVDPLKEQHANKKNKDSTVGIVRLNPISKEDGGKRGKGHRERQEGQGGSRGHGIEGADGLGDSSRSGNGGRNSNDNRIRSPTLESASSSSTENSGSSLRIHTDFVTIYLLVFSIYIPTLISIQSNL